MLVTERNEGDRPADDVIEAYVRDHGIDGLEDLLADLFHWRMPGAPVQPQLPAEILGFLDEDPAPPAWFTGAGDPWQRIANARQLYQRSRRTAMVVLGCASLPYCYAHGEIAGALIMSGRLASQVRRRLGETANFVHTVMGEDALQKGGAGLLWIRKVRLIHAAMRALLLEDYARHQHRDDESVANVLLKRRWVYRDRQPINQVEMAYVLLTFSLVVVDGWKALGITVSDEEQSDYLFAWAFIGHLMGIQEPLLSRCTTRARAEALFAEIIASQRARQQQAERLVDEIARGQRLPDETEAAEAVEIVGAIESGRLLTAALLVLLRKSVLDNQPDAAPWFNKTLAQSVIRWLVDTQTAEQLWVDPAPVVRSVLHQLLIGVGGIARLGRGESGLCTDFGRSIEQSFCGQAPRFSAAARGD